MANAHNQFLVFEKNISITPKKKTKLRESRKALENRIIDFFKSKKGLPVPKFYIQGSYKMGTMVVDEKDGTYDVDLGIYFLTKPTIVPVTLQKNVYEAVKGHTEGGAEHRDKCIRVVYKGDFDIDLPVYYKTPNDKYPFLATKNDWQTSDPKQLCDWFEERKDKNGQMVRVVKYVKAWAKARSKKMPSGIAISVWVAQCFKANGRDDVALLETLKVLKSNLWCGVECINPAAPKDDLCAKLDNNQKNNFKEALKNFMDEADKAVNRTDNLQSACNIWRQLLGGQFPAVEEKKIK